MLNIKKLIHILTLSIGISSCATILTGTTNKVSIYTKPERADLFLNGGYAGTTPFTGSFNREIDYNIYVRKEGYEDASTVATRHLNPVSLLNTIVFPFWIIDIMTGAVWSFDDQSIFIPLKPLPLNPLHVEKNAGKNSRPLQTNTKP